MEDLLRLKEARIQALQNELFNLKQEVDKLKADAEIHNNLITDIYNENR